MNEDMALRDTKRIWGWWFFDWASQPYATLLMTFIFPIYYAEVARAHFMTLGEDIVQAGASAQSLWGYGLAIAGVVIAVFAPILGALADATGKRMLWTLIFSLAYVAGSFALWYLMPNGNGLYFAIIAFGIGLIGMEFATIFTNSLLPGLVPKSEIGRVSGTGYAFGYLGGVVSLAIMLLLLAETASGETLLGIRPIFGLDPALREGTRAVGPFTAIWYILFMIPFFLWMREPKVPQTGKGVRAALSSLWDLIRSLRHRPSLSAWLLSSMFSRDALNALYAFGGVYAASVLGWPVFLAGIFGVVSAISAAILTWLGGRADYRWGPRPVIIGSSIALIVVCSILVGMSRQSLFGIPFGAESSLPDAIFFACGVAIGGAGGILQSASRTLMVHHTSPAKAAETFGLYALSGKATAFLAPLLIALVTDATGSQHLGISPLIVMFILALILLFWVKPQGDTEQ